MPPRMFERNCDESNKFVGQKGSLINFVQIKINYEMISFNK